MCEHHHEHHHHEHCGHNHNHEHNGECCSNTLRPKKIAAAVVILALAFIPLLPEILKIGLFLAAYLIAGGDVLLTALKNIKKGDFFDENFLMGVATLGAFAIGEYPEAVMVMVLYQIGEYYQHKAVEKSRRSVTELMDIRPDYANIEEGGGLVRKSPEEIKTGDIIVVCAGEKIPLDGVVVEGEASVDTSALTGESVPRNIKEGGNAVSGCINTNGLLKIRVTKEFGESTVSKILELVENASAKKAKAENFITKFAKYYTPAVVLGAVLLAVLPPLVTGADFAIWIKRALTFLVISCPCALVISVPLGFFAGIGGASRNGILVKGSCYLEALSKPDTIVFDKTGTLTKGVFSVTSISPEAGVSEEELLKAAAMAENYSSHPIAQSLKKAYGKTINSEDVKDVTEIAGSGVRANVEGNEILAGNSKLMEKFSIDYKKAPGDGTVVYAAKNGKYLGYIVISDVIKEDSGKTIETLKKLQVKTVMLTGDNFEAAEKTAAALGLDEFYAHLLPEDKVAKLEEIISSKQKNKSVIFAGDGINDAPVLTRADAGIAMGGLGSDAAIEAADIVIMNDSPSKIILAVKIARKTMSIVKQNIVFALTIKALFLLLGTVGLMSMWGAVFADAGVTLIAVLNSLRALRIH